jgi:hypothetical protein
VRQNDRRVWPARLEVAQRVVEYCQGATKGCAALKNPQTIKNN